MSAKGFVYILINPSMPNLMKIGKTTRSPEDRAKELSAATGVATPFIVAYQIEVNDCNNCEHYIHKLLEITGHRVNPSKEFFKADMTDVINMLIDYKNQYDTTRSMDGGDCYNDSDDKTLGDSTPLVDEENKANIWHYGFDDHIIDFSEIMQHYKNAIQLGSKTACSSLACLLSLLGILDVDDVTYILLEGKDMGDIDCYRILSDYYLNLCNQTLQEQYIQRYSDWNDELACGFENGQICFRQYIRASRKTYGEHFGQKHSFAFWAACYIIKIHKISTYGGPIDYNIISMLKSCKTEIYKRLYNIESGLEKVRHLGLDTNDQFYVETFNNDFHKSYDEIFAYM